MKARPRWLAFSPPSRPSPNPAPPAVQHPRLGQQALQHVHGQPCHGAACVATARVGEGDLRGMPGMCSTRALGSSVCTMSTTSPGIV